MFKKIGFKLIVVVGIAAVLIIGVFSFYNIRSHSNALFFIVMLNMFQHPQLKLKIPKQVRNYLMGIRCSRKLVLN